MEGRDKPQSTDAHKEHQQALPYIETGIIPAVWHSNPFCLYSFRQHALHHQQRNEPGCKTWQQKRQEIMSSRYSTHIPHHQSFRISDNGKSSATVGRKKNGTSIHHALTTVWNHSMHHRKHHHCCSKIIEICRDNKGYGSENP